MFALPAIPQDVPILPQHPTVAGEIRTAVAPEIARIVAATDETEYDEAVEELVENGELPPVPVDMNKVLEAFEAESGTFFEAMGEFARMRKNVPYGKEATLRDAIDDVRETVFSGKVSLEWSRLIMAVIESGVSLAALFIALHHGVSPSRFFTSTLARRSLRAHRDLRLYLEAQATGRVSEAIPPTTTTKVDDWTAKATANRVHRPFGDHVD